MEQHTLDDAHQKVLECDKLARRYWVIYWSRAKFAAPDWRHNIAKHCLELREAAGLARNALNRVRKDLLRACDPKKTYASIKHREGAIATDITTHPLAHEAAVAWCNRLGAVLERVGNPASEMTLDDLRRDLEQLGEPAWATADLELEWAAACQKLSDVQGHDARLDSLRTDDNSNAGTQQGEGETPKLAAACERPPGVQGEQAAPFDPPVQLRDDSFCLKSERRHVNEAGPGRVQLTPGEGETPKPAAACERPPGVQGEQAPVRDAGTRGHGKIPEIATRIRNSHGRELFLLQCDTLAKGATIYDANREFLKKNRKKLGRTDAERKATFELAKKAAFRARKRMKHGH